MDEATNKAEPLPAAPLTRRDSGVTFIETLVAIVLLGTAVVGLLTAVRATTIGTALERDQARAHQWLQSASELVRSMDPIGCSGEAPATVATNYRTALRDAGLNPPGWAQEQLTVESPIRVWDGSSYEFQSGPVTCSDEILMLQLIKVTITSPDGHIIESVEVIKRV